MLELIYGAGLRVSELVTLRVKDIDFDAGCLTVRSGKGDKDRTTFMPSRLIDDVREYLAGVRERHNRDLAAGAGEAPMPAAISRKYPNAGREWGWQYVFPSGKLDNGADGVIRRWHIATSTVQREMKAAVVTLRVRSRRDWVPVVCLMA